MRDIRRFLGGTFALDAALLAQDQLFKGGPHFASSLIAWGVLTVAGLGWVAASDTALDWALRRPKLKLGQGVEQFWRMANGSREGNADLQVLYSRVRNAKDGGGEKATVRDAELWMEAFDENGNRVGTAKGNWLDLSLGKPYPVTMRTATLKPMKRHEYGIEISGKFLWADNAWIAGEGDPPSLTPGKYTITASVDDGTSKGKMFKWKLTNPGPDELLIGTVED